MISRHMSDNIQSDLVIATNDTTEYSTFVEYFPWTDIFLTKLLPYKEKSHLTTPTVILGDKSHFKIHFSIFRPTENITGQFVFIKLSNCRKLFPMMLQQYNRQVNKEDQINRDHLISR